jgi:hypothetical protein
MMSATTNTKANSNARSRLFCKGLDDDGTIKNYEKMGKK